MLHNDLTTRILIEDRNRELRHRAKQRQRPQAPRNRWTRPGRR
jgi:hypothetical protein